MKNLPKQDSQFTLLVVWASFYEKPSLFPTINREPEREKACGYHFIG